MGNIEKVRLVRGPSAAEVAEGNWSSLIDVFGYQYALSYVAGQINVYGHGDKRGQSSRILWQKKANGDLARAYAKSELEKLGPEFEAKHRELYELA